MDRAIGSDAALLARAKPRPRLLDVAHPDGLPPEYAFLLEQRSGGRPPAEAGWIPVPRYLLLDSLRFSLTPAGQAGTKDVRQRRFGPLTIFVLPPS